MPAAAAGLWAAGWPGPAAAAGLRARLAQRDLTQLTSPIFNIPPREQAFPDWLEGTWAVEQKFSGFGFPVLPQEKVGKEEDVPGFKTCSIIDLADVGKTPLGYEMRWVRERGAVVEDLPFNVASSVGAHLPKGNVSRVDYMPEKDPNRWSVYVSGSKNAERVEVFVNSRDSELAQDNPDLFFTSEYRRQVTFSSRVLQGYNGNYQHFRIFKRLGDGSVRLNILTASYLDPLSPLYFEAVDKPVVVFRHEAGLFFMRGRPFGEDPRSDRSRRLAGAGTVGSLASHVREAILTRSAAVGG